MDLSNLASKAGARSIQGWNLIAPYDGILLISEYGSTDAAWVDAATAVGILTSTVGLPDKDYIYNQIEAMAEELRIDFAGYQFSRSNMEPAGGVADKDWVANEIESASDELRVDVQGMAFSRSNAAPDGGLADKDYVANEIEAAVDEAKIDVAGMNFSRSNMDPSGGVADKDWVTNEIEAACDDVRRDMNANRSYAMFAACETFNPVDATNYHFGGLIHLAPHTSAGNRILNVLTAGTIKAAIVNWVGTTAAGTGQTISMYIRKNNTTDYLIESIADTATVKVFDNYALDIQVVPGDYIEFKIVSPTWTTNPTGVYCDGHVYIENNPTLS